MENFIGQIQAFGFPFAPKGWSTCDGQLLTIAQNTALYSLLGGTYGGNGSSNFALPDLRGRTMLHQGNGGGLSSRPIGQSSGTEQATLNVSNMPTHNHPLMAFNGASTTNTPGGNALATSSGTDGNNEPIPITVYAPPGAMTPMAQASIGTAGSSVPFQIMPPFLVVNVCIALTGIFPTRP